MNPSRNQRFRFPLPVGTTVFLLVILILLIWLNLRGVHTRPWMSEDLISRCGWPWRLAGGFKYGFMLDKWVPPWQAICGNLLFAAIVLHVSYLLWTGLTQWRKVHLKPSLISCVVALVVAGLWMLWNFTPDFTSDGAKLAGGNYGFPFGWMKGYGNLPWPTGRISDGNIYTQGVGGWSRVNIKGAALNAGIGLMVVVSCLGISETLVRRYKKLRKAEGHRGKRPLFRLRLSTCVTTMIGTGLLVGLNVHSSQRMILFNAYSENPGSWFICYEFGWPVDMHCGFFKAPGPTLRHHVGKDPHGHRPMVKPEYMTLYRKPVGFEGFWFRDALSANVAVFVLLVGLIAASSEAVVRWLERKEAMI